MRFIDEVSIQIQSGHGGHGCVSFRREKFVPKGGPDGGCGGRGGDVYFEGSLGLNTLLHFRGKRKYTAPSGAGGAGQGKDGPGGEDLVLKVPVGTLVKNAESGDLIADLNEPGKRILIAKGGKGGLGNMFFKTSTNQAPRFAQDGKPGVDLDLQLELRLLADIALVGLPNAGKSTCISVLSKAKPKIADYPFTTLEPNLGVTQLGEKTLVLADIPGLIEGASDGKGLGIKFLRHIERTKALCHLIDCSMLIDEYELMDSYITIRNEIEKYGDRLTKKREIICLTKIDAMSDTEISRFKDFLESQLDKKVLPISSVSGKNIPQLQSILFKVNDVATEEMH